MTVLALDLIGIISQDENPIKMNITHNKKVLMLYKLFFLVYLIEKTKNTINKTAVIIVPESKGSPIVFTKKTSRYPTLPPFYFTLHFNLTLQIATEKILAKMKFFKLGLGYFLKK